MKIYVTFGQTHTHSVNGKIFDKDCIAVIEAIDMNEGRQKTFEYFGDKFFTTYKREQLSPATIAFFPRGFIEVE